MPHPANDFPKDTLGSPACTDDQSKRGFHSSSPSKPHLPPHLHSFLCLHGLSARLFFSVSSTWVMPVNGRNQSLGLTHSSVFTQETAESLQRLKRSDSYITVWVFLNTFSQVTNLLSKGVRGYHHRCCSTVDNTWTHRETRVSITSASLSATQTCRSIHSCDLWPLSPSHTEHQHAYLSCF